VTSVGGAPPVARELHTLPGPELLALWEQGSGLSRYGRGRLLLRAAYGFDDATDRTLGEWNRLLLTAFVERYGRSFEALVDCPACGVALEFDVPVPEEPATAPTSGSFEHEGRTHGFRAPTVRDLEAARGHPPGEARRIVAQACLGNPVGSDEDLVRALESAVRELDPLIAPETELSCSVCDHGWRSPLDPGAFLWERVDFAARQLLLDVHDLAVTYGWGPEQALSLGRHARRTLLDMASR